MSYKGQDVLYDKLKEPEFARAYHQLDPAYQVAKEVIALRAKRNLSQREVAERVGTKQTGISRLENMSSTPSLSFLQRIADALDAKLEVRLVPREDVGQ